MYLLKGDYKPKYTLNSISEAAPNYDALLEKATEIPTYERQTLKEATQYFQKEFLIGTAKDTGSKSLSDLRKKVNMTRPALSTKVNNVLYISDALKQIADTNKSKSYSQSAYDPSKDILDPISKRVFLEARRNGYDIKSQTRRFKAIYANNMAREMGLLEAANEMGYAQAIQLDQKDLVKKGAKKASEVLDVDLKTVQSMIDEYYQSPMNQAKMDYELEDRVQKSSIISMEEFRNKKEKTLDSIDDAVGF